MSATTTDRRASRQEGHKQFQIDLREALFERFNLEAKESYILKLSRRSTNDIVWIFTAQNELIKLFKRFFAQLVEMLVVTP